MLRPFRLVLSWLLVFSFFFAVSDAVWAQTIGSVERVAGVVTISDAAGTSRAAQAGQPIAEGDTVTTGDDGEVLFKMVDSGAVALRPRTQMRFTQYRFESKPTDSSVISLVKGSVRALTGLIGKLHPDQSFIRTPAATIGIRGTDHETLVLLEDTPDGTAGTYDRVYEGGTYIEAENGQRLPVQPNQVGFSPQDALKIAAQLGVLKGVPRFFVTGRFDDLFALFQQELQRRLQDRLNQATKGRLNNLPIPIPDSIGNLLK
ncbi:MAG: FecR domain-containing protein [Burkholderiaceae bacterium]